jgi:hypothetical protein
MQGAPNLLAMLLGLKTIDRRNCMKSLWKTSAVLAVALGATVAQADVTGTSTTTGSSLVLFVRDVSEGAATNRVYARDLGPLLDSVLTAPLGTDPYTGPVHQINYSLPTYQPDDALNTFLDGGNSFVWTLMAADTQGTGALAQRYLTTTNLDFAADTSLIPNNSTLRGQFSNINAMLSALNVFLPDTTGSSTAVDGQWGQSGTNYSSMSDWNSGVNNQNTLGATANLYVLVTSATNNTNGNLAAARVYQGVSVRLTVDGVLEVVPPTSDVPLPPAIYLLGSAVAALTGVARRRRKGEQAKA